MGLFDSLVNAAGDMMGQGGDTLSAVSNLIQENGGVGGLVEKFQHNLATRFPAKRVHDILALCQDGKQLASTPVHAFMDLLVI